MCEIHSKFFHAVGSHDIYFTWDINKKTQPLYFLPKNLLKHANTSNNSHCKCILRLPLTENNDFKVYSLEFNTNVFRIIELLKILEVSVWGVDKIC